MQPEELRVELIEVVEVVTERVMRCLIKTASLIVNARNAVTGLLPPRWS